MQCVECGATMRQRTSKTGDTFWGCSKFPACRYTVSGNDVNAQSSSASTEILTLKKKVSILEARLDRLELAARNDAAAQNRDIANRALRAKR